MQRLMACYYQRYDMQFTLGCVLELSYCISGLARVEIFLGLTATVQRYRILPQRGVEIDLEPTMASTIKLPKLQGLRLEKVF